MAVANNEVHAICSGLERYVTRFGNLLHCRIVGIYKRDTWRSCRVRLMRQYRLARCRRVSSASQVLDETWMQGCRVQNQRSNFAVTAYAFGSGLIKMWQG